MSTKNNFSVSSAITGIIFIAIGLSVFAIRLTHDGAYAMPQGAGFLGAIIAIIVGALIIWPGKPKFLLWLALPIAIVASLPAIYSIAGESQEVISLYALDSNKQVVDLRLWIVDKEDGAWVGMGKDKATTYKLDGSKLEMLRGGKKVCVAPKLFEDLQTASAIHLMKLEKYTTAQVASAAGLYPKEAGASTVALRLDPCL